VNPERFAAELPALFEDFPESQQPRGRRFDDVAGAVPNLATENTLAVVNLAASLLDPGESYVEAGTFMGASLIAAARDNYEGADLVAIDNFSFGPTTVKGRDLPAASRAALDANLERFGVRAATILEGDTLDVLCSGALGDRRVGVFYYDACHDTNVTLEALRLVEPSLAEPALVIVDDCDWADVRRAVDGYLAAQPRARSLVEIEGASAGQPWWWEGMAVLAWSS
jgi:predicted O-methyltransferase YrrM